MSGSIAKDGGDAIGAATMGLSHISLSRRQHSHAAGTYLTACWLTGQTKSPLGIFTNWDVDCSPDLAHSCWASLLSPPFPAHTNFALSHLPPCSRPLHTHLQTHHTPDTPSHTHTLTHASLSCLTTRGSSLYARSGFPASHIEPRPVPTP